MILRIRRSHPDAALPAKAHPDDACFDVTATSVNITSRTSRIYGTGIHLEIPKGYHVKAHIRSSLAFKKDLILANGTGIIDCGFIGELMLKLAYIGDGTPEWPWVGDRVAQIELVKNTKTEIQETHDTTDTERGDGGFGSSGR